MMFNYVQDAYQKNQPRTRFDKTYMIPVVNIISRKARTVDIKGAGGALSPSARDLGGGAP